MHEVEVINGVGSAFFVQTPAWHRYGIVLDSPPSLDEGIQLARLGYPVEKRRTFLEVTTEDGVVYQPSDTAFVTVRTDTGRELGAVSDRYQVVQNVDAFRVIEPLLDKGVLALDAGGVLRDGADAWLLAKWDIAKFGPITQEVFGAEIVPYVLLANNHSGRRGILVQKTNIRVVCANTLGFAESSTEERRVVDHTGEAHQKLVDAAEELLLNFIEEYEVLSLQYRQLRETQLTEAQFKELVLDVVTPDPRLHTRFNPDARMAELVVTRHETKVREVTRLWEQGAGHLGDHSAWEAYNGAVEALDHNESLWPNRAGVYRTQSLLDGTLARMKQRVLENLVEASRE